MELHRLYEKGKLGQMVVLDSVGLGSNSPLAQYEQPAFFTIKDVVTTSEGITYTLEDPKGNVVNAGSSSYWLTALPEWQAYTKDRDAKEKARNEETLKTLRDQLHVLKEVMSSQGLRVVTSEQADTLGLSTPPVPKVRRVNI